MGFYHYLERFIFDLLKSNAYCHDLLAMVSRQECDRLPAIGEHWIIKSDLYYIFL